MKIKVPASVARAATRCLAGVKKASPEIALVTGLLGVVGTTVFACRQTTKLNDILGPRKADLDLVHAKKVDEKYTEKDQKKDIVKVYIHTAWDMTKLYGPVLLAEAASLGLVLLSHRQLRMRNASLSVAVSSITAAFNEYRNRVRAELGDEADKRFRYGLKAKQITVTDEEGNEKTVEAFEGTLSKEDLYMRVFDEHTSNFATRMQKRRPDGTPVYDEYGNPVYIQDVERDLYMLHGKEQMWTDIKAGRKNKKVYLNEVLADLDFDIVDYGQDVGWFGDDPVDFRPDIVVRTDENGNEYTTIVLDFNCDGCIRDEAINTKKPREKRIKRPVVARARKVVTA